MNESDRVAAPHSTPQGLHAVVLRWTHVRLLASVCTDSAPASLPSAVSYHASLCPRACHLAFFSFFPSAPGPLHGLLPLPSRQFPLATCTAASSSRRSQLK